MPASTSSSARSDHFKDAEEGGVDEGWRAGDQIDFNEEVRKESEEVLEADRLAKEADKKPLWEQLAGKRDEKQAKFDAVRAAMFAPPRALDDEESNFLQGVEAQRREANERKEKWEAEELRGFALARANQTVVAIAEPKKPKPAAHQAERDREKQEVRAGAAPPVVAVKIKPKRKRDKGKGKDEKRAKRRASASAVAEIASAGVVVDDSLGVISGGGDASDSEGDAPATAGKGKGREDGGGGDAGGHGDGDAGGDVDTKDKEGGGEGLFSLLGAYGSDSDSSEGA